MLGGAFMNIKKGFLNVFLLSLAIAFISYCFCNVKVFSSNFIFVVPFIFFSFLIDKKYGVISFFSSLLFLFVIDAMNVLLMIVVLLGLVLVNQIIKKFNIRIVVVVSTINFFVVFLCGILDLFIYNKGLSVFPFINGVISYWLMYFYFKLYFVFNGVEKGVLDSKLTSFVFVLLGCSIIGLDLNIGIVDVSLILILILTFLSVKVGLDVGAVYVLSIMGVLLVSNGYEITLSIVGYTFLIAFFLERVSKGGIFFTYEITGLFLFYYFDLNYLMFINLVCAGVFVLLIPKSFTRFIGERCYGSKLYVEKICDYNKKSNLEIANKIIKMEEVFSLVCEKININDRIKKNDRRLLVKEVNVFDSLLKRFSSDIKRKVNFNSNYIVEEFFYSYGVDLLDFKMSEDVFKRKVIFMDVRCEKKEIKEFILPLVNKAVKNSFDIFSCKYNEMFCYYSMVLKSKSRANFKYGISQQSFCDDVCGDSYLVYENEHKYIFAISDGMGVGKSAREYSKETLELFKKFMDIGFSEEQTLESINNVLRSKYAREGYSTLDLLIYDKDLDKFFVSKNGANDSYLINKEKNVIKGSGLPIGIVENLKIEKREMVFVKGDCYVMVSDGVAENSVKNIDIGKSVQRISDDIIRCDSYVNDDKTVFVIKIC